VTIATVKEIAADFLTREDLGVLALKGSWGVGKTHFWDSLIKELGSSLKPTQYCYASLFGIASKRELSIALYASVQDFKAPEPKPPRRIGNINVWLPEDLVAAAGWCTKYFAKHKEYSPFGDIPWIKNLPRAFEAFVSQRIMNAVICLDDFERLDENTFTSEELMGFINELKEKKKCKVVLIFNEENLGNKKNIYEKYREKVIEIELLYAPTSQESVAIAVQGDTPYHENIVAHAKALGLTNIRVLRIIVKIAKLMHAKVEALKPQVMERAVRILVLFAWCYYERNEQKPTLEFLIEWNPYSSLLGKKSGSEKEPQHERWETLLHNYGFTLVEDFDLTIQAIIEQGYLEETRFVEEAQKWDAQLQNAQDQADLNSIWDALNNSFDNNTDEFIEVVRTKCEKHIHFMSLRFLNGLVIVLRELGQDDFADKLIIEYSAVRKDEMALFDLKSPHNQLHDTDPILRQRCQELHAKAKMSPTLDQAITRISTNDWDDEHIEALQNATADDFYNCFRQHKGSNLTNFVRACTQFTGIEKYKIIGSNVHNALLRIGNECPINRFRVINRFNITQEELDKSR